MHFRPLHDRVAVRRIEAEEKTAGGIIIPDTAKEKPQEGGTTIQEMVPRFVTLCVGGGGLIQGVPD